MLMRPLFPSLFSLLHRRLLHSAVAFQRDAQQMPA
jgi:hypothetical protein